MPTKKLKRRDQKFLLNLGQRIEKVILTDRKYKSLDAYALEHHDTIAKATLYQLCEGKRDMKISTLLGLCKALEIKPEDMIRGIF